MASSKRTDPRLKKYDTTVTDFVQEESGYFVALTDDTSFIKLLQNTIVKQLAISSKCIFVESDTKKTLEALQNLRKKKYRLMIFVERFLQGRPTTDFIEGVLAQYPDAYCIVLSGEVEKSALVYLYEIGVNNFIIKPLSMNILVEKIAMTLRPQTKLGDLIDRAKTKISQGEYEEALEVSEEILHMKPNSAAGLMVKGDAFYNLGDKGKAVEAYKEAHKSARMFLDPLKRLEHFYKKEGDIHSQVDYLTKLDSLSPLNVRRKLSLGQLNVEIGNSKEAERNFDGALAVATKESMAIIGDVASKIADICVASEPKLAEKFCRKALEMKKNMLGKSDIEVFNKLGISLRKQGKWHEAVKEYQKALEISPKDEILLYNIAMAFLEGNKASSSLKYIDKALRLNEFFYEGSAAITYNIGMIYFKNRESDTAKKFFKLSLRYEPNYKPSVKMLEKMDG